MEKKPPVQKLLIMAGILTLTLGAFFAGGMVLSAAHAASLGKPGKPGTPGPANVVKGTVTVTSVAGNTIKATVLDLPPNFPKNRAITITTTASTTYAPDQSMVAPGKTIFVVGTLNQDGSITASQIGFFDPTSGSLSGTITTIAGATITVQAEEKPGQDQTFPILVTASTTFSKVDLSPSTKSSQPATFRDLAVGETIEADGTWNRDGTLTASHVVIMPTSAGTK